MINYLITSILLSAIGGIVYLLFVKRNAQPLHRKFFIYLVVLSSLGLPALSSEQDSLSQRLVSPETTAPFGSNWQVNELQLQHFCNCENPNFAHHVSYRSNALYNFFVKNKKTFTLILLVAMGLVLLRILIQYGYLYRLMKLSEREEMVFGGKKYTVLHTPKPHSIGAFQLDKPYIIWQEEMDSLETDELNAIIQHELSHLKQFNTIEKALLSLIHCWWLLNPFFYLFRRELDLISELIADQQGLKALGSRKKYAQLLLRLTEMKALPVVSHFLGGSDLKGRIEFLLKNPPAPPINPLLTLIFVLGLQFTLVNTLSAQVTNTLQRLETYEEIYIKHPEEEACYYCTDCHSVCFPGDE